MLNDSEHYNDVIIDFVKALKLKPGKVPVPTSVLMELFIPYAAEDGIKVNSHNFGRKMAQVGFKARVRGSDRCFYLDRSY